MAVPPLKLRFVQSATDVAQLPPTRGEVAVVGRSNVGKSSLINALANRNGLAKVSKTPGRTQLLNLFELPDGTSLVDLPGYGFADVPAAVRARWPEMIEGYLLRREHLRAVVVLIDAAVGPTRNDVETLGWLRSHGLPVHVVATKHDKVKPSKRAVRQAELAAGCGLEVADVLWVSAAKHVNLDELRSRILGWVQPDDAGSGGRPGGGKARGKRAKAPSAASPPSTPTSGGGSETDAEPYDDEHEWN